MTIDFAFATVVTIRDIKAGDSFTKENIWVKRPDPKVLLELPQKHSSSPALHLNVQVKVLLDKDWLYASTHTELSYFLGY